jgi:hypothetical protein
MKVAQASAASCGLIVAARGAKGTRVPARSDSILLGLHKAGFQKEIEVMREYGDEWVAHLDSKHCGLESAP